MPPVTRTEIADCLAEAFSAGAVTRADLLLSAGGAGARLETIEVLEQLPDRRYSELRDLWNSLPDVPVELSPPEASKA